MTNWKSIQPLSRPGHRMRRRELLFLLAGATTTPGALRAQQKRAPLIGFLSDNLPDPASPGVVAFRQGLSESGYVDGQNVAIEYRWSEGRVDRLPALAADFVDRGVDLILAVGEAAFAAKNATSTIPIIFSFGGDPVAAGLVASFARPGGNLTGTAIMMAELTPKRLQLLSELVPQANVFALLVNPNSPGTEPIIRGLQDTVRAKGLQLHILKAGSESEIDTAFANLTQQHVDALVVSNDPFFWSLRDRFVALADSHAVPACYFSREFAAAGGLISYGPNLVAVYRRLGFYAGKILNGAKPADLPVEQPTTLELVINLKTAKTLGLTVPPSILVRADEVIE
jgi:putative tryptophan/tyrosine transport system substrate-binding protein